MLNQPHSSLSADPADTEALPDVGGRFRLLFGLFVVAGVVVLARASWIQLRTRPLFLDALNATTVHYDLIPARDGRIISESMVLAADVDRYSLEVHYRWLQAEPAERWLRHMLRQQLTRQERGDETLRESQRSQLLQQRQELWQRLQQVTGRTSDQLDQRRQQIETRVQRVADDVNRRRQQRLRQAGATSANEDSDALPTAESDAWWLRAAAAVRKAVTSSPRRTVDDRIVVREEEDFHVVVRDLPVGVAAEIRSHPEQYPGTRVSVSSRRVYPQPELASHLTGARTPLREAEVEQLDERVRQAMSSWRPTQGRSGVEFAHDRQLRGTPGLRKVVRNRRQQMLESTVERAPVAGRDVVLTIDVGLQQHTEQLLAEVLMDSPPQLLPQPDEEDSGARPIPRGAAAVVLDVTSGRVAALASAPTFQLTLFTSGTEQDWEAARADTRQPFLCRPLMMALPPGSVFKPVTAVAALQQGQLHPDDRLFCQGFLDTPDKHRCLIFRQHGVGHNDITLHRALAQSCNVYFFQAARTTGLPSLVHWSQQLGYGQPTGIDLPFERSGSLPPAPTVEATDRQRVQMQQETMGLAIGQSRLAATPLQVVCMMAAIANGGWLVTPHVVSQDGVARTADELAASTKRRGTPRRKIPSLDPDHLVAIREGLEAVVQQPYGTGYRTVRLESVRVAGKSGTAETGADTADHAWFAGYFPADRPRYAFVVALENGGSGSRAAGPVAREIIRYCVEHQL